MSTAEITVVAPLGPNPAPLTELVWALVHDEGQSISTVTLIVDGEGLMRLSTEVLMPGGPWDELHDVLDGRLPAAHALRIYVSDDARGRGYDATVWAAARALVEQSGPRPVVFALAAGRARTMTAAATVIFQLLARPVDRLVDVRVDDRRVEGATGFFFPGQSGAVVVGTDVIDPATVRVQLQDVSVPRLRGFLPAVPLSAAPFTTWQQAVEAGQAMLDQTEPPSLHIDLLAGAATVDGEPLKLSPARLLWYSALAAVRSADHAGDGWLRSADQGPLLDMISRTQAWSERHLTGWMQDLVATDEHDNPEAAAKLRSATRRDVERWVGSDLRRRLLIPETRRVHDHTVWRLPLPAACIRLTDLPPR